MKENEDKNIEQLVSKIMSDATLESPSIDFTSKVMSQINTVGIKNTTIYKPLISKMTWFFILGSFILLVAYFIIFSNIQGSNWFNNFDFSLMNNNAIFNSLSELKFSKITICAVLLSSVMLFIQITLLKHSFNKKFEL